MSNLRVTSLRGRTVGVAPTLPDGAVITGVATATTFDGNVVGTAATFTTIQASNYVGVPEGTNVLKAMLFS